ncbi:MAG TPA: protease modulator HflC [Stellaceae bacterium]|nr:protease modulator HflC [Stellaceae bacterium]
MKTRLAIPLLALAVVLLIVISGSVFTVDQTEQALVLQFGKPVAPINEPGLHFKLPLIQNVVFYDKRILYLEPSAEEVNAADQKRLVVDSYARYRIVDPLQFYQSVGTEAVANTRLASIVNSALRRVIGNVQLASVVADKRAEVMRQVRDDVNGQARAFGIDVIDVRIRRADLPSENSQAIFERMKTERQREAAQFRAEGAREAQKIRANADRQRIEILADAQKQSQILRGEGDANSIRISAEAFGRDPAFYAFYRSLEAYRGALANSDTTLVLTPDSEFFRYFNSETGGEPAGAGGDNKPKQ